MRVERKHIRQIIKETILALCNSGVCFDNELCVEGLIGITVDKDEVFLVNFNENLNKFKPASESANSTPKNSDKITTQTKHTATSDEGSSPRHWKTHSDNDSDTIDYHTEHNMNMNSTSIGQKGVLADEFTEVVTTSSSRSRRRNASVIDPELRGDVTSSVKKHRTTESLEVTTDDHRQLHPLSCLSPKAAEFGYIAQECDIVTNIKQECVDIYQEDAPSIAPSSGHQQYYTEELKQGSWFCSANEEHGQYPAVTNVPSKDDSLLQVNRFAQSTTANNILNGINELSFRMPRKRMVRFNARHDILLLREVIANNPFRNPKVWTMIAENLVKTDSCLQVDRRRCRERTMLLLDYFKRNYTATLRRCGTEKDFQEKESLLCQVNELFERRESMIQTDTPRERQESEWCSSGVFPTSLHEANASIPLAPVSREYNQMPLSEAETQSYHERPASHIPHHLKSSQVPSAIISQKELQLDADHVHVIQ